MALIQMKLYSASLKTRTNINVLVPTLLPDAGSVNDAGQSFEEYYESHNEPRKDCPVLYLLHGTFGDESDWQRYSRIEDYARRKNVVIVMPYGENSCYLDTETGKNYETYITRELPSIIRWMFPVSHKREETFIAGLSMGGGAAVRLGLTYPDRYGYVAGLSADFGAIAEQVCQSNFSVWSFAFAGKEIGKGSSTDSFSLVKKLRENEKEAPQLYLGCGTDDFLYADNQAFHQYLDSIGMDHVFSFEAGGHNWDFWDDQIKRVLEWLPVKNIRGAEHGSGF